MEILFIEKKGFSELGENCHFNTVFSFCAIYSTAPHQCHGVQNVGGPSWQLVGVRWFRADGKL